MENKNVIATDLEKAANRLFNYFSEIMERTSSEKSEGDNKYRSIWEFWEKEL